MEEEVDWTPQELLKNVLPSEDGIFPISLAGTGSGRERG